MKNIEKGEKIEEKWEMNISWNNKRISQKEKMWGLFFVFPTQKCN